MHYYTRDMDPAWEAARHVAQLIASLSLLSLNIIRAQDDEMTLPVHGRSHACAKAFCIPMHRSEEAVVNMEVHALL